MRIHCFTNAVAGGWGPADLETGLGGSEEVVILWSRALARLGADVTVFHTPRPTHASEQIEKGVRYLPRQCFDPAASRDVLVTWKDSRPWLLGARADVRIHWSSDVERPWPYGVAAALDAFACLTPYHASRMPWVPQERLRIVPHGIDLAALEAARCERDPTVALYASSPDRGLEQVLRDWPRIRDRHGDLTLHVTYGWRHFDACAARGPMDHAAATFRARMEALLRQPGVVAHGALSREAIHRMYWKARYWVLPLVTPDAELFCLNALKARHAGALPVIHRCGGLLDTVNAWLPYPHFVSTPAAALGPPQRVETPATPILDWDDIVRTHWLPMLRGRS